MRDIIFISEFSISDIKRTLVERLCRIVSKKILLPDIIEVEFKILSKNVYAETSLNPKFQNRIFINEDLDDNEIIKPLIHELIHLNQKIEGKLSILRDGSFVWENKAYKISKSMSYNEYKNLPWEYDVFLKEKEINKFLLESIKKE